MVKYCDRLEQAMKAANVSPTELARSLDVSYQAVRKVLLGGQFGTTNNAAAAKRLGVSSDWLASGKPPMRVGDPVATQHHEYAQLLMDLADIPPSRRQAIIEEIHRAAEETREAAAYLSSRPKQEQQQPRPTTALSPEERARVGALRREAKPPPPSKGTRRAG